MKIPYVKVLRNIVREFRCIRERDLLSSNYSRLSNEYEEDEYDEGENRHDCNRNRSEDEKSDKKKREIRDVASEATARTASTTTKTTVAENEKNLAKYASKPIRFKVLSYSIPKTFNLLRHVYVEFEGIEIHAGMSNDDPNDAELTFTDSDYFGKGRIEGIVETCEDCANRMIAKMSERNKRFHIIFNNCDTIVPFVMQTSILWLSIMGLLIGYLIFVHNDEFNEFVLVMIAPACAFSLMLAVNRMDRSSSRDNDLLWKCTHVRATELKYFKFW